MATNPFDMDDLLGAYALDAVDEDERRAVEDYLAASPRARAEVQQHREVATMLAWSGMDAPEGLWERISDSLGKREHVEAAQLGQVLDLGGRRRKSRYRTAVAWVAASAAAGLLAVVAVRSFSTSTTQPSLAGLDASVTRALADPDTVEAQLVADGSELKVRAIVDPNGQGYLLASSLPKLADDRTYQLWGQIDGELISLGVLGSDPSITTFTAVGDITLLAITAEVSGGVISSVQPAVVSGALT